MGDEENACIAGRGISWGVIPCKIDAHNRAHTRPLHFEKFACISKNVLLQKTMEKHNISIMTHTL